jgi:glycosyltransferase involved in cell wall biosynthesis
MEIAFNDAEGRGKGSSEDFAIEEGMERVVGLEVPLEAADLPSIDHADSRALRIALVSTPFLAVPPKNYGGTELVIYELAEGLAEAGHEVVLFGTGDSQTSAELRSLYATSQWPPNPLHEQNHVSWALHQVSLENFDVVHVHSACALAQARLLPDVPIVYTLHHPPLPEFSEYYQSFPNPIYVAISRRQRELEAPLPRCEVIHHGLDANRFQCVEEAEDFVCFVGRYSECKGPHTAIDAARLAGLPIRIAGEVHEPDRTFAEKELVWRLNQPHVTNLGCIGIEQKVPLLRDARALLTPITWEEPFGLILIEAMLSGCPVVSFGQGSAPELIEQGITGYVVNDVAEMTRVIQPGGVLDNFDRRRCQRVARRRFGRERLIADHVRLYRTALQERASILRVASA